jgi:hypothetical protein
MQNLRISTTPQLTVRPTCICWFCVRYGGRFGHGADAKNNTISKERRGREVVTFNKNGDASSVCCKFCGFEGKEIFVAVGSGTTGQKRARSTTVKYFTLPCSLKQYRSHFNQHGESSWANYKALSLEEKKFTNFTTKGVNTLHSHMEMATEIVEFLISSPIVDMIIGDMFF